MTKTAADSGDRSANVTPRLADAFCVAIGGRPSKAKRRAMPAASPIPPASPLPAASPIPPALPVPKAESQA